MSRQILFTSYKHKFEKKKYNIRHIINDVLIEKFYLHLISPCLCAVAQHEKYIHPTNQIPKSIQIHKQQARFLFFIATFITICLKPKQQTTFIRFERTLIGDTPS